MNENPSQKSRPKKVAVTGALGRVLEQVRSGDFSPEKRSMGPGVEGTAGVAPAVAQRFFPTKGFAKVPARVCRPWALADRPDNEFEHQSEVARSLKDDGQIQPAVVRLLQDASHPELRYEVIAGQVRWRAAKEAGVDLEVTIRELTDEAAFRLMVGENEFRRNLSDYARAKRLARSLEVGLYKDKSALAKACGISASQLSYLLGFAELDPVIVARFKNVANVSARLGYVLNSAARGGHRENVLRELARVESGEIARDQIPGVWEEASKETGKPGKIFPGKNERASAPLLQVKDSSGRVLFTVKNSSESGPVIRFSKSIGGHIDSKFLEQLEQLLKQRLK